MKKNSSQQILQKFENAFFLIVGPHSTGKSPFWENPSGPSKKSESILAPRKKKSRLMIPFHASSARAYYCSNSDVNQKYPEISTIWGGFLNQNPIISKGVTGTHLCIQSTEDGSLAGNTCHMDRLPGSPTLAPPVTVGHLRNGSAGAGAGYATSLRGFDLSRWKREWFLGQLGPAPGKCVYPQSC